MGMTDDRLGSILHHWRHKKGPAANTIHKLLGEIRDLKLEQFRLQAIVNKLPKTADGVVIEQGQRLWYTVRSHPEPLWLDVGHCSHDGYGWVVWGESQHESMDSVSAAFCYSTREAAEAARNTP